MLVPKSVRQSFNISFGPLTKTCRGTIYVTPHAHAHTQNLNLTYLLKKGIQILTGSRINL